MNEKVLHTLEFDKITATLSEYCGSEPAKKMCGSLRPSNNAEWIASAQAATADAFTRLLKSDRLSFGANFDLRPILKDASIGRCLSMAELLRIARLLQCIADVSEYGEKTAPDTGDSLSEAFKALYPSPGLKDEILRCILSEDEMADDASSELKRIRGEYAVIGGRIHKELNRMVSSTYASYLQDALITQRGDRYCIPVKAEYKGQVPGIVHDSSSSGSTLFIEPAAIVEMNNKLAMLKQEEDDEIRRILMALSGRVAQEEESLKESQHMLTRLDFAFGKAKYALALNAVRPLYNTEGRIKLIKARHPLLDPAKAVPIDVKLGGEYDQLIITGPNTGGKTVSLKTVGLLCLMGQSGLHIPTMDRSELSLFGEVFADIGDEQSIEQSLSTFSSHMSSIVWILKKARADSLVLFDELGAGTDPTEGAALAMAILTRLHQRGIRCMATTHYSELKLYALSTEGVENASCEFDVESLSPTYRLLIGIPGKSNAFAIAKKLGLSEEIIEDAGKYINSEDESFETVISELQDKRLHLEKQQGDFDAQRRELERRLKELEDREEKLESRKDKILSDARQEAKEILQEAKDVADETIRAFNKQGGQMRMDTMEKKRSGLRQRIASQDEALWREEMKRRPGSDKKESVGAALSAKEAVPGTTVHILSMDIDGTIVSPPDKEGKVQVQAGIITSRVALEELVKTDKTEIPAATVKRSARPLDLSRASNVSSEINVLGCTVDEAIAKVDKYLDDACLSHVESVRIVHGKGTGALRKGLHDYLRYNSVVKSFSLAEHGEGDAGVTIVKL
ncbi:MAG: endonuclease MutS2 [Lachnospiraceae bacterium]|nr:endonuclease MutS2 [Lachnospiraceae bacterium]